MQTAATRRNVKAWGIAPGIGLEHECPEGAGWRNASTFRPFRAFSVAIHFSQGDALGFHMSGLWPRLLCTSPKNISWPNP